MKTSIALLLLLFGYGYCFCQETTDMKYAKKNVSSKTFKIINGSWFNGKSFTRKTVWVEDGLLRFEKIGTDIDSIVDLQSRYVIPPFAEAHNHNLESGYKLRDRIRSYLNNGVFYVKLLSSIKKRIGPLLHHYNRPAGLDVSLAHAPLTATGGHPIALRKAFLNKGYFEGLFETIEEIESHGYWIIDKNKDLEEKWAQILSCKPDFIKIMLLYSEEYNQRKTDTAYFGNKGLNPQLISKIVRKAHQNGLRVSAHVETAHDFHVAVKANVDEIAHLPEIDNGKLIAIEDAKLAKEKGIIIVTTISLVKKHKDCENYNHLVNNVRSNLKLLKSVGVKMAIGSDMYNDNSTEEFDFLHQLGIFSNLELLKMWTENAIGTIFPNRKIGKLTDGYEASFLVVDKDPIGDISEIYKSIYLEMKEGEILNSTDSK